PITSTWLDTLSVSSEITSEAALPSGCVKIDSRDSMSTRVSARYNGVAEMESTKTPAPTASDTPRTSHHLRLRVPKRWPRSTSTSSAILLLPIPYYTTTASPIGSDPSDGALRRSTSRGIRAHPPKEVGAPTLAR